MIDRVIDFMVSLFTFRALCLHVIVQDVHPTAHNPSQVPRHEALQWFTQLPLQFPLQFPLQLQLQEPIQPPLQLSGVCSDLTSKVGIVAINRIGNILFVNFLKKERLDIISIVVLF